MTPWTKAILSNQSMESIYSDSLIYLRKFAVTSDSQSHADTMRELAEHNGIKANIADSGQYRYSNTPLFSSHPYKIPDELSRGLLVLNKPCSQSCAEAKWPGLCLRKVPEDCDLRAIMFCTHAEKEFG